MTGARIINRRRVLLNPEGSPAFDAGYKWLLQRIKTAKGSFSTEPGALAYLKKQGLEGTRDLSRVEFLGHPQVIERIERAEAIYRDFIDGASRAHEDRVHRYDEEYQAYRNPPDESVQEKSWREWQENFARVSADPESASITDLMRAIGYLDKVRSSIQRHAWEQGKKADANVIAGYVNEEQYYQRLIEQKQGRRNATRITQRDVDSAAASYHNLLMQYDENNMATNRAEWKYRELQRAYAEQQAKRKASK